MSSELGEVCVAENDRRVELGRFSFDVENRVLFDCGQVVKLTPKSCELLALLIEFNGRVLTKSEIMERVWRGTHVEESNLTHHIAALRRVLGDGMIETLPRKGYRFSLAQSEPDFPADGKGVVARNDANGSLRWPVWPVIATFAVVVVIAGLIGAASHLMSASVTRGVGRTLVLSNVTNSGVNNSASISPDGRYVAYIQNFKNQAGALYVRRVGTNVEHEIFRNDTGTFGVTAFSRDGEFIFFHVKDHTDGREKLFRLAVEGGEPLLLSDKLTNGYFILSPNNDRAAIIRYDTVRRVSELVAITLDGSGDESVIEEFPFSETQPFPGGSWSPDGRRIAFAARSRELTEGFSREITPIFEFDLETSVLRRITQETWESVGLIRWLPDGNGLVANARKPRGRNQVYFVDYQTGEARNISNDANGYSNYGLGVTADGETLVTDDWRFDLRIWTVPTDDNSRTPRLLPAGRPINSFSGLSAFPDGRIVFSTRTGKNTDIWLVAADGSGLSPLTSDEYDDLFPVVSPDAGFIVFVSDRSDDGQSHLFRMNPDGTGMVQLTTGPRFADGLPDVSPDGKTIVYQSNSFDSTSNTWERTIRAVSSEGGVTRLVATDCQAPSFSPDGSKIACTEGKTDYRGTIRIAEFSTGQTLAKFEVPWTHHDELPVRWTPTGDAVVFRDQEKQIGNLWRQSLDGGAPTKLTNFDSQIIFNFAYSHDGKTLLVSRGEVRVDVVMFSNLKEAIAK